VRRPEGRHYSTARLRVQDYIKAAPRAQSQWSGHVGADVSRVGDEWEVCCKRRVAAAGLKPPKLQLSRPFFHHPALLLPIPSTLDARRSISTMLLPWSSTVHVHLKSPVAHCSSLQHSGLWYSQLTSWHTNTRCILLQPPGYVFVV